MGEILVRAPLHQGDHGLLTPDDFQRIHELDRHPGGGEIRRPIDVPGREDRLPLLDL